MLVIIRRDVVLVIVGGFGVSLKWEGVVSSDQWEVSPGEFNKTDPMIWDLLLHQ